MKNNNEFFDHFNDELLKCIKFNEDDEEFEKGFILWDDLIIVMNRFRTPIGHDSDCGLHNEPAERNTGCTCKLSVLNCN